MLTGCTRITVQPVKQAPGAILSLPINATTADKIHVSIEIPKGYKCIQDDILSTFLEFVPASDLTERLWTEIITTTSYINRNLKAKPFVDSIKKRVLELDSAAKILEEQSYDTQEYNVATLTISYHFNNRKELMFIHYFSGLYDCAGYQHTFALTGKMSEKKALIAIKKFAQDNVKVINLPNIFSNNRL